MKRQNYRIYGKANKRDIFIKTRSSDLLGHYLFTICKPFQGRNYEYVAYG